MPVLWVVAVIFVVSVVGFHHWTRACFAIRSEAMRAGCIPCHLLRVQRCFVGRRACGCYPHRLASCAAIAREFPRGGNLA